MAKKNSEYGYSRLAFKPEVARAVRAGAWQTGLGFNEYILRCIEAYAIVHGNPLAQNNDGPRDRVEATAHMHPSSRQLLESMLHDNYKSVQAGRFATIRLFNALAQERKIKVDVLDSVARAALIEIEATAMAFIGSGSATPVCTYWIQKFLTDSEDKSPLTLLMHLSDYLPIPEHILLEAKRAKPQSR